jgi:hypothetical protein
MDKKTPKSAEFPTPERMRQNGGITIEPVDRNIRGDVIQVRAKAKHTCVLDFYLTMETITGEMWAAGTKFALYHFTSGKLPRTTVMYGDRVSGLQGHDPNAGPSDAQLKLREALGILTPSEQDVVWDVCGSDQYAGTGGRIRDLRTGLRALSIHWGIKPLE